MLPRARAISLITLRNYVKIVLQKKALVKFLTRAILHRVK